ncbi:MAG: Swt1 family HEPN domain-containing protein, partial [Eggerthellales bacterium]|nr:Swt1 family HEPN domain-containing protein [Eggerthellales bacterium]
MGSTDNLRLVTEGFNKLLEALSTYVAMELIRTYGDDRWWKDGVLDKLFEDQRRNLPLSGSYEELVDSLDVAACLLIMDVQWREVFRKKLPQDCRNYIMELKGTRNSWAHVGPQGFSDSDTARALDTMSRLCEQVDPEIAAEINVLLRTARYGNAEGSMANTTNAAPAPAKPKGAMPETRAVRGLPSWRDVMEPHMDVAEGRYKNAEFAADLAQVARGKGELEYRDPVEFFNRTFVTEGMKGLLVQSLRRVCGLDGEPVIQLKTAFGGGKTHSMLALYHMMRSRRRVDQIKNLQPVLEAAGVGEIPEVHVAVLVGTALNPAKAKVPATMPGIKVNTLWGEMAFQLAESVGDPSIYEHVKDADKRGVSPGSEALASMFDACGCCLVLMDELVAYAKKLYGQDKLPAGTLDNFITFIQELTEAARASKSSLVVASIPESDNEIGGEAGQRALEQIEHTFGRMEAIWKPVGASEGFEVVRRRLFLNCKDEAAREDVCSAFSRMYNENASDFPVESRELEYKERMISCYPIHPEVFDRLYEDWATLERFQRTRGVLRLMASV